MKAKKIILNLLLLSFLSISFQLLAEDETNYLVVKWKRKYWSDTEYLYLPYTQKTKIRFPKEYYNSGVTKIITDSEVYEFETHLVIGILYTAEKSSIQEITDFSEDVKFTKKGIDLDISKLNTRFGIYTIDGKILMFDTLQPGKHSISLSHLTPGIYIVKLNNKSFKILKK